MNLWKHKGYTGRFEMDLDSDVIHGRVVDTRDVITFEGETIAEAKQAFIDSVDDYLTFCAERGEEPEKPYSGKTQLRMPRQLHRQLAIEAEAQGLSFNDLVLGRLVAPVDPRSARMYEDRACVSFREMLEWSEANGLSSPDDRPDLDELLIDSIAFRFDASRYAKVPELSPEEIRMNVVHSILGSVHSSDAKINEQPTTVATERLDRTARYVAEQFAKIRDRSTSLTTPAENKAELRIGVRRNS